MKPSQAAWNDGMANTKDARLEIRLTQRMKRDVERAALDYDTTPSRLLRALFTRFKQDEWKPSVRR